MNEDLESKRTKCEIFSRITGYFRPIDAWNQSKQAEFLNRKTYNVKNMEDED
jgi:ribonucleoside-triphosphate reductase (formate)